MEKTPPWNSMRPELFQVIVSFLPSNEILQLLYLSRMGYNAVVTGGKIGWLLLKELEEKKGFQLKESMSSTWMSYYTLRLVERCVECGSMCLSVTARLPCNHLYDRYTLDPDLHVLCTRCGITCECGNRVCLSCIHSCVGCEGDICDVCSIECDECGEAFCDGDDCMRTCSRCINKLCRACVCNCRD